MFINHSHPKIPLIYTFVIAMAYFTLIVEISNMFHRHVLIHLISFIVCSSTSRLIYILCREELVWRNEFELYWRCCSFRLRQSFSDTMSTKPNGPLACTGQLLYTVYICVKKPAGSSEGRAAQKHLNFAWSTYDHGNIFLACCQCLCCQSWSWFPCWTSEKCTCFRQRSALL